MGNEKKIAEAYPQHPRPLLLNEDSVHLDSLDTAFEEYAWGAIPPVNGNFF